MTDNELIAEFMGEQICFNKFGANWKEILRMQGAKDGAPPYHESWDWLMPCCEKWHNLPFLKDTILRESQLDWRDHLKNAVSSYDIRRAHSQLVINIKWYLKNTK